MELGKKLLQARQEAGLSQKQLCGDRITRNMLSQIEHGTAQPSMQTLKYLAERLGKPVSYFLEDSLCVSSNQRCMEEAWAAFEARRFEDAYSLLGEYRWPDPLFDREYSLLSWLVLVSLGEQAASESREVQAREYLFRAQQMEEGLSFLPELKIRRIRVRHRLTDDIPLNEFTNLDQDLCMYAKSAMDSGEDARALHFLEAAENKTSPEWNLLRGKAALHQREYGIAARYLQAAEKTYPEQTVSDLERCFRELGDFKLAYEYACKGRK